MTQNLHPLTMSALNRADKERRLQQPGKVIWLYGLSGAGKSTLAVALERQLAAENYVTHLLDGDNIRLGLNRDLGFTDKDRAENIRRVAETAKLFAQAGIVVICSFITPLRAHRALAREIISPADLIEVHIAASYAVCAQRDPKGLYAKAAAGNLPGFTGRDSAFEPPTSAEPTLILGTETPTPEESLLQLHTFVTARLRLP
jgi:adenylylsulfate kinase